MQNEVKNPNINEQEFLQAEPAELDESSLHCVAAAMMASNPRTDCICCKACATQVC